MVIYGYIMFVGAGLMNGVARNGNEKKKTESEPFVGVIVFICIYCGCITNSNCGSYLVGHFNPMEK